MDKTIDSSLDQPKEDLPSDKKYSSESIRKKKIILIPLVLIGIVITIFVLIFVYQRFFSDQSGSVKSATAQTRSPIALGISLPYGRASQDVNVDLAIAEIEAFAAPVSEGGVGAYPATYSIWMDFEQGNWRYGSRDTFPNKKLMDYLDSKNITPVIFLTPVGNGINKSGNNRQAAERFSNQSIADGSFDEFFNDFAASASAYGKPVVVRYAWEMNGNWFPWSPYDPNGNGKDYYDVGNTPQNYVSAWRHIYDLVKTQAPNVMFYWCSHNAPYSSYLASFYPGNQYVDIIGFDAYNFYPSSSSNQKLSTIYKANVLAMRKLTTGSTTKLSTKPIVVGETGLLSKNSNRVEYLDYGAIYNQYPDIAGIIYFDLDVDYLFGVKAESGRNWRLSGKSENPAITTQGPDMRPKYAKFAANSKFKGRLFEQTANQFSPTPTLSDQVTSSPTPTPTIGANPASPVTSNINVKADTYVKSDSPSSNFGTSNFLSTKASGPNNITYFKFTLPNLSGKTITEAKLRLTTSNSDDAAVGNANRIALKSTTNNWTESALTYSNKPSAGSVIATKNGEIAKNETFELDVLSGVVGKTGDVSFVLESTNDNKNNLIINSSNASSKKPLLIITYQ